MPVAQRRTLDTGGTGCCEAERHPRWDPSPLANPTADFAELPLPDQLHPDAAAHRRIGERFAKLSFTANGVFTDSSG